MKKLTLRPCPFCGCSADVCTNGNKAYWAVCSGEACVAEGPVRRTEDAAIAAWSKRVEPKKL
jgi:hypothetical protein